MYEIKDGNTLVNIANSILKANGLKTFHESYKPLDEILERNPDKPIVLCLFDGLGRVILDEHSEEAKFINAHRKPFDVTSVFPPTTVAATTSITTGLYPCETGWMGWTGYFKEENTIVDMFSSRVSGSETIFTPTTSERLHNVTLMDMINSDTDGRNDKAYNLAGHTMFKHGEENSKVYFDRLQEEIDKGYKFIYAYYTEPDGSMHVYGCNSKEVSKIISNLDRDFAEIVKRNPDVLFISLADHGHLDIVERDITEYPDVDNLIEGRYFNEPRALMVNVKEGKKDEFYKAFTKHYEDVYEIYTKEEVIAKNIFGYGEKTHPNFEKMLGDFLCVALDSDTLYYPCDFGIFKAHHAGGTYREIAIPVSVYND